MREFFVMEGSVLIIAHECGRFQPGTRGKFETQESHIDVTGGSPYVHGDPTCRFVYLWPGGPVSQMVCAGP